MVVNGLILVKARCSITAFCQFGNCCYGIILCADLIPMLLSLGMSPVSSYRLDISGMLQSKLQSGRTTGGDSDANKPNNMVRGC